MVEALDRFLEMCGFDSERLFSGLAAFFCRTQAGWLYIYDPFDTGEVLCSWATSCSYFSGALFV